MHMSHFIPQTTLWVKYCYFPNFTNKENDDLKEELPEVTHFVSGRTGTGTTDSNVKAPAPDLQSSMLPKSLR